MLGLKGKQADVEVHQGARGSVVIDFTSGKRIVQAIELGAVPWSACEQMYPMAAIRESQWAKGKFTVQNGAAWIYVRECHGPADLFGTGGVGC